MKNKQTLTGTLHIIRRLDSSYYGNPRFLASVNGINFKTSVDSMLGYSIQNYENKLVNATIGEHYNSLTLDNIEEIKQ